MAGCWDVLHLDRLADNTPEVPGKGFDRKTNNFQQTVTLCAIADWTKHMKCN